MPKKASLIGATGLIGGQLLALLEQDTAFDHITLLVRSPFACSNPKVLVKQLDFADLAAFKSTIAGSQAVFCCVGTTQKKVKGDLAAYRKVDFDIPVNAARLAAETGADQFLMVSSVGADSKSNNFYLKLKGETEEEVKKSNVPGTHFFRPSMLLGKRAERRPAEKIGQLVMAFFSPLIPSNYKPIDAATVAAAMLRVAKQNQKGTHIYHYAGMLSGAAH